MTTRKLKLTNARVRDLPARAETITYWDSELPGFGVRVMAHSGTKTYVLQRRTRQGRSIKIKLGRAGEVSADWARQRARELIREIEAGADPARELKEQRLAARARREAPSVRLMIEEWVQTNAGGWRASTVENYRMWADLHILPKLGSRKAHEVEPGDVRRLYKELTATGRAATANRTLAVLSSAYSWARSSDDWPSITVNPCLGAIGKRDKLEENKRERYLDAEELTRLVSVLRDRGDGYAAFFSTLLMTGARRGELETARWVDFSLDADPPTWRKPRASTKQKRDHLVPLAPEVADLLRRLKAEAPFGGPFTRLGKSSIRREWGAIRRAAELTDFRIHDLRHQFASLLISNGFTLELIGQLLGHSNANTTARYSHLLLEPQRLAAGKVAEVVDLAGRRQ